MLDYNTIINGLNVIRSFFEIRQPSQSAIFDSYQNIIDGAIKLLNEQSQQTNIKEPCCLICSQQTCRYWHENKQPEECKSYVKR